MTDPALLRELTEADAQGERAIVALKPGDSFQWRGWHTIASLQASQTTTERLFVRCTDGREFYMHPFLMFPSLLTEEHERELAAPAPEIW